MTRQLESGPDPELMAIDPKGEIIYIANEDDSLVTIMDIKSGDILAEVPVGVEPEGMGVSPDGKFTVATSELTSMAHVIDNATNKLIANVLVDSRPREAKFTPDGKELWVSSEVGGTISVIDPKTWKVTKRRSASRCPACAPSSLQPVGMDFTKDGKLVFVAARSVQSRRRHRHRDQGGQGLHSGRPTSLAWRDQPRRHEISTSPTASPTT